MEYRHIRLDKADRVQIITINRPEMTNKLNIACLDEMVHALRQADANRDCGTVILTGSGEYFCNGGELGDFRTQGPGEIRAFGDSFIRLHTTITGLSKAVVAAVQGHALGGGFSLVEACDLAVASEEALFGVPEIKGGLAPMMALAGVSRVLTRKQTMELSLLGEPFDARRARDVGLVNWICPSGEVLETARRIAGRIAVSSPTAIALCKKLYAGIDTLGHSVQLERGLDMLVSLLKSEDATEALAARDAQRDPVWKGR